MPSSLPNDAARLKRALDRALQEPLSVADRKQALDFIRTELPAFEVSGRTTYLVLGSYRDEFEQNLRLVQSELNKGRTRSRQSLATFAIRISRSAQHSRSSSISRRRTLTGW